MYSSAKKMCDIHIYIHIYMCIYMYVLERKEDVRVVLEGAEHGHDERVLDLVERLGFAEHALGLDVGLDARLQLHLERVPGFGSGLGLLATDGAD